MGMPSADTHKKAFHARIVVSATVLRAPASCLFMDFSVLEVMTPKGYSVSEKLATGHDATTSYSVTHVEAGSFRSCEKVTLIPCF